MPKQNLQEKVFNKGGENGDQVVADPADKKATLPNSKTEGEKTPPLRSAADLQSSTPSMGTGSAESNKASINMKASEASAETVDNLDKFAKEDITIEVAFEGEELSEDFKEKASTIFEAAVAAKVHLAEQELQEQYKAKLEEEVAEFTGKLSEQIDSYLNYVVEKWMEENELAIETSLRTEITEEFIEGMKKLFAENYIEIPEEKLDVLEQLASRVEELEEKLNETISENIDLSSEIKEHTKARILSQVAEDLTVTQKEKFSTLAEGVDFVDADTYEKKLQIVKENYFVKSKAVVSDIHESEVESAEEPEAEVRKVSGPVAHYVQAISRTIKK